MTVQVVFSRNHSVGSFLLRGFLWSPWSHCALIDGNNVIEAKAFHGVVERPLGDFISDASKYEILDLPGGMEQVVTAARTQLGKPYDWWGAAGIGFRRHWQKVDAWFCSELVAWAFAEAGWPLFRVPPSRITPQDIYIPIMSTPHPAAND